MHIESKNQNTKRGMETKNITCFWIKQTYRANPMRKASSMSKDSNIRNPHFGKYFCCSLVIVFDWEHKKRFIIHDP